MKNSVVNWVKKDQMGCVIFECQDRVIEDDNIVTTVCSISLGMGFIEFYDSIEFCFLNGIDEKYKDYLIGTSTLRLRSNETKYQLNSFCNDVFDNLKGDNGIYEVPQDIQDKIREYLDIRCLTPEIMEKFQRDIDAIYQEEDREQKITTLLNEVMGYEEGVIIQLAVYSRERAYFEMTDKLFNLIASRNIEEKKDLTEDLRGILYNISKREDVGEQVIDMLNQLCGGVNENHISRLRDCHDAINLMQTTWDIYNEQKRLNAANSHALL